MLMGTGPYLNTQIQLQFPAIIHQTAAQLALRALLSLPGEKKAPPFASVQQAPAEPYAKFIDRLWAAIPDHLDLTVESKSSVFKMLSFDNAKANTRNILVTLPRTALVEDMLERVQRADQSRQPDVVAQDCQRFAFTVPSINKQAPEKRYEWLVLPQGMRNSPTLCQLYVAWALEPIRTVWCNVIVYHYMDNIWFGRPECFQDSDLKFIWDTLEAKGLKIAPEKVQQKQPWLYWGWKISDSTIRPQKVDIATMLHNLTDVQMFLGNIQWGRHIVWITNDDLAILLPLLQCRSAEPQITLTNDYRQALSQITSKVAAGTACRHIADVALSFLISNHVSHPFAVLGQWQKGKGENKGRQRQKQYQEDATDTNSMGNRSSISDTGDGKGGMIGQHFQVLEWIFLPIQPKMSVQTRAEAIAELVREGCSRSIEIRGQEPGDLPGSTQDHLEWCLQQSMPLQEAVLDYMGLVHSQTPKGPLWHDIRSYKWQVAPRLLSRPVVGRTVYTDAGGSRKAVRVWYKNENWEKYIILGETGDSLQTLALSAVVWTCQCWMHKQINIVSGSLYFVNVVKWIEDALIRQTKRDRLLSLFLPLRDAIQGRTAPYCVIHIHSHQFSIGLAEGNSRADKLVSMVTAGPESDFTHARVLHEMFHQNAKGLQRMLGFTWTEAKGIVRACPSCSHRGPGLGLGISPRGVKALEVWQMDIMHVPEFGTKRYVRVSIDTCSKFIWAKVQEKKHFTCVDI
uniref:RNA-directed DNA polymerase n=1 Tax=Anas zonorhyncha TaxID=75864 RepID=A0A8B9VCJ6_9AVES